MGVSQLSRIVSSLGLLLVATACGNTSEESDGAGDDDGESSEAALAAGTVYMMSLNGCSTSVVRPLTDQLVSEIACLSPKTLSSIETIPNLELGPDALPLLQTPLVAALTAAAKANGAPIQITSALRTLPQQYLLSRWAARKRCGITMAAAVGQSNHEEGMAVDLAAPGGAAANKKLRASMIANQMAWLGPSDAVHYTYQGKGVELQGLSVVAFKRLWNRNHPEAKIAENDTYDPTVEAKLKSAPADGFPIGARCDSVAKD